MPRTLLPASLALTVALATQPVLADTAVLVETDPATFALSGFALHLRVNPGGGHLVTGVGAYGLDFPALLVDLDAANRDAGWHVRLRLGAGAFTDYYFAPGATGWFVGAQLAVQRYRYDNDDSPAPSASSTNLLVMPRFGLQWSPFDRAGVYLMPWLGLGYTTQLAGSRMVGGREYHLAALVPYAAVHVGWKF